MPSRSCCFQYGWWSLPPPPQGEQLLEKGGVHVGARARAWDEPEATAQHACKCVRACACVGGRERECWRGSPPFLTVQPERHPLSEQLLQMIYVASQGGLPGFLFHLQKKELCWNVIRELGIKLTAAFCFPCDGASPSDCGIWFLHSQPELNVGKDQLRKGHREGQCF